jgi:peptidylprolyl isomerase
VRRRPLLLLAVAAVVPVVVLAGCSKSSGDAGASGSSTSTSTDAPSPTGTWSGELPTVDGAFGTESTITMPKGSAPTDLQVKVLKQGDGATLEKGQLAVVKYVGAIWNTGKVFDSSFAHGGVVGFPIGVGQVIAGWDEGLVGQKVGTRVLLVIPPDKGYGASGQPQAGITGTDSLVFVVDIIGAHAGDESAAGKATPPQDDGVPGVTVTSGKPTIRIPPGDAPNKLIVYPVITGSGPKVEKGDTIIAQYVGVVWRNGKQFDASWDRGQPVAVPIGKAQVIKGWDEGLVGQTVGSRVVLVLPPDYAYGAKGNPPQIKPTDTLVFAVDILAAYH